MQLGKNFGAGSWLAYGKRAKPEFTKTQGHDPNAAAKVLGSMHGEPYRLHNCFP